MSKLLKILKPLQKIAKQVIAHKEELQQESAANAKASARIVDRNVQITAEIAEVDAVLELDLFKTVITKK